MRMNDIIEKRLSMLVSDLIDSDRASLLATTPTVSYTEGWHRHLTQFSRKTCLHTRKFLRLNNIATFFG